MSEKKVMSNFIWRFAERCGAQIVSLIVSVVLARILSPDDYGTVALVTVFTTILQVFVDSGLGVALIQKKDADDLDFSSVFYFNLLVCVILYTGMFVCAPVIAKFYGRPELVKIVRVISLTILISGVKNIQQAYVSRNMLFKKFFWATIGGTVFSAVLGIAMAYSGFGVWSLVAQSLSNTFIDTVILWITVRWRPRMVFSWKRLKGLLSYGWKLLASALLDTGYNNLRNLIIGKMYSSADLAYYTQGDKLPLVLVNNINTSIDSVLLPSMSQAQDNKERVKAMTRKSITVSIYIMAPLMIGLAVCSPALVKLVFTEKWLPCVFYLRIFCVTYIFYPVHTANLNALRAIGRSDLFLKLEIEKKIVGFGLLFCTMWFGVDAMAYSLLVSTLTSMLINCSPNKKILSYSFKEQMKDIFPSLALACLMGGIVLIESLIPIPTFALLILQVTTGIVVYAALSKAFHLKEFEFLVSVLINTLQNKKEHKK